MSSTCIQSYARPATIPEAVELMNATGACVLAGGTDLVIMCAEGSIMCEHLVDVSRIAEFSGVARRNGEISIGSGTCCDDLVSKDDFTENAVVDGAALVGGWQTRLRATVGGNVCRASPGADTLCGLLVLDARFELVSVAGTRMLAAADFFTGPGTTLRRPNEILKRIVIPERPGGSAYARFTYRNSMDLAVAGVAVFLEIRDGHCIDATVAIGAYGPKPLLVPDATQALVGSTVDEAAIEAACAAVVSAAQPIDDVRGTRWHRLHVLRPLTRRVTLTALKRARDTEKRALP